MLVKSTPNPLCELDARAREIFRLTVDIYLSSGAPVGSRTLSRICDLNLSPATIRNVMYDMEQMGLLYAPHISAGRMPTERGLRLFIDGLLEIGDVTDADRKMLETKAHRAGRSFEKVLTESISRLAGLSRCVGLVVAPKSDAPLKHIEFIKLSDHQALVILVSADGGIENRVIGLPAGLPASSLIQAANYLTERFIGRTISEIQSGICEEITRAQIELDEAASHMVEAGLAVWSGSEKDHKNQDRSLIIRGQQHLLEDVTVHEDIKRVQNLFQELERKNNVIKLLDLADGGEGVQIFIGSETNLFSMSESTVIAAPYKDKDMQILGAIGVIGPTRVNYARIVPMVDYTAKMVSRLLSGEMK